MNFVRITQSIVIATVVLLIIWDIFVFFKGVDATISVQIWNWSKGYPIVPFASGVLCGHLFWAQKESDE